MKKSHGIGLALFTVLAFSAFGAASALALPIIPQWLVEGNTIALEHKVNVNIEPLAAGEKILLEDMGAPGTPDILCEISGALGWLLPNGADEQTTGECLNAEDDKGTCATGSVKVAPVHLPWTTLLLESESGAYTDDLTGGTGGAPGWEVKCTVSGIAVTDTCTTDNGKTTLVSTSDGLIEGSFPETVTKPEQANCVVTGLIKETHTEEGLVVGSFFLHALNEKEELISLTLSLVEEVS